MALQLLNRLVSLRKLAVKNLQNKEIDVEVFIEQCYRHYSHEYHTALHIAKEKIPQEQVILIFMEDEMKDLTIEDLESFKNEICKLDSTSPMIQAPVMAETEEDTILDDEAWIAQQTALINKQDEKEKKAKQLSNEEIVKKTHEAIRNLTGALGEFQKKKKKDKK